MTSPEATFAQFVLAIDAGMAIVTAEVDGEPTGCLVGFHTQTSIDPPRYLACISRLNHTHGLALRAQTLIVHAVPARAAALAELFGGETGDAVDKLARVAWRRGPGGAPLLTELPTWFAGTVLDRLDLGDHTGFLLAPAQAGAGEWEEPLRFHRARRIDPGHPA